MSGRVFVMGDNIDTDQLAPGQYMKGGINELAAHCLEMIYPQFALSVRPGDVIVAGRNFGLGSSREQAAEALRYLGIQAVVANSFGGIFYRNAINLGLPVLIAKSTEMIKEGDRVELSIELARLRILENTNTNQYVDVALEPVPVNIQQLLSDGGLVAHLKKRFESEKAGMHR